MIRFKEGEVTTAELSKKTVEPDSLERRFITVMFCDMVGSTALSERLDPEDLREIFHLFREAVYAVVHKYHGHIASVFGDGLMIYFGYPATHEEDAILAARAGLEIIEDLKTVNNKVRSLFKEELSVRIGIHTGLVVVETIGVGDSHQEDTAVGVTPNIAARLQELAQPNELLISSVTWRLLKFQFYTASLGREQLKGIKEPVQIFRVISFDKKHAEVIPASLWGYTPRVDRERELEELLGCWSASAAGKGQTVLVVGEAGIGKTRLAKEFIRELDPETYLHFDYFGSEYHGNIAFYPIIERLQRVYDLDSLEEPEKRQQVFQALFGSELETDSRLLLAFDALLTSRGQEMNLPPGLDPQDVKVAIRKAMYGFLKTAAKQQPVLVWVDDYQWLDFTSREILHPLTSLLENLPIMLLITSRPGPFLDQIYGLDAKTILLEGLNRKHGRELCANVFDRQTPSVDVLDLLIERSGGVPLFLEELSASVLESAWSDHKKGESAKKFTVNDHDIPTSLTGTIMARLDRLGEAKEVAYAAAVQGQTFDGDIVGSICNLDSESLAKSLSLLVNAGLIVEQNAADRVYRFKHALVKEVAVNSLVRSQRRRLNLAVAKAIEGERSDFSAQENDLLGHYYEQAGEFKAACHRYFLAGSESVKKSANVEAINQLRQGLAALLKLPEGSERDQLELKIQVTMIGPAIAAFGYAAQDVEVILERALELLSRVPKSPLVFPVLFSRWAVLQVLGKTRNAYQVALKTQKLAAGLSDTGARLIAHRLLGTSYILLGNPTKGIPELEQALALFNPVEHSHLVHICGTDPFVSANALLAFARWMTGSANESTKHAWAAIDLAEAGGHANTIGYALTHIGVLFAVRGDVASTRDVAERLLSFATSKELPFWIANARAFQGWVLANSGAPEQALDIFMKGLVFLEKAGLVYWRPTYLSWIAQAHMACGVPDKALIFLDEAEEVIATSEESWMESEIWRLKGVASLQTQEVDPDEVQSCFIKARNIATEQKSLNLEIRAVVDLARLFAEQQEIDKAKSLLKDFMHSYPIDSSPVEAQEATALLAELAVKGD